MKIGNLLDQIGQHKTQSSRSWLTDIFPFLARYKFTHRTFSPKLIELEAAAEMLSKNITHDGEMTLDELYRVSEILFRKNGNANADIDDQFFESLQRKMIGSYQEDCFTAQTILKNNNRLSARYWDVISPRRSDLMLPLTSFLCSIPEEQLTDGALRIIAACHAPTMTVLRVAVHLSQNNCLTENMLSILMCPDIDYAMVSNALVMCKAYGAESPVVTAKLVNLGEHSPQSFDRFLRCIEELHLANAINEKTIPTIFGMYGVLDLIENIKDGLIILQNAGLLDYAHALVGAYGRYHPDVIAKVLVLFNHFNYLTPENVEKYINQHRGPEAYFESLELLKNNNINNPEYVEFVISHGGINTLPTIQLTVTLEKATIVFNVNELRNIAKRVGILVASDLLSQENFDKIKVAKLSGCDLSCLEEFANERVITQALLDELFGGKTVGSLMKQIQSDISATGSRPNMAAYARFFGDAPSVVTTPAPADPTAAMANNR